MDLKAYAIERKLAGQGDLLSYVTKGQAIPLDVIDQNFQDVLADRHDDTAELLSTDYRKYLHQEVKMKFSRASASQMQVSGDIDDNVVDIIESVHHVNKHEIVKETVQDVMNDFNPHDTVKFDQIDLYHEAEDFVRETTPGQTVNATPTDRPTQSESPAKPAPSVQPSDGVSETHEPTPSTESNQQTSRSHIPEPTTPPTLENDANDFDQVNDQIDLPEDDVPSPAQDELPDDLNTDFLNNHLPKSNLDSSDFANSMTPSNTLAGMAGMDASNAGVNNQSQSVVTAAYHQAYDYLRDELKKYKLDSRLPGLDLD